MIADELLSLAQQKPQSPAIITAAGRSTYSQLAEVAQAAARTLKECSAQRVGVWCDEMPTLVATLMALDSLGAQAVLFSAGSTVDHVRKMAVSWQVAVVATDKTVAHASAETRPLFRAIDLAAREPASAQHTCGRSGASSVVLFTSGTSGAPKPAIHTWSTLSSGVNRDPKYRNRLWLLAYEPTSFAGIQVCLQALLTGGCLCVPSARDPVLAATMLLSEHVEFASATPSFWRLLLLGARPEDLASSALVQITLGGETVDQSVLDALRTAFPQARITHIYASTEMGVCFSVNDDMAGFPASYLNDESLPCHLRMSHQGELEIQSRRAMLGYLPQGKVGGLSDTMQSSQPSAWFATGDLVELRNDRVYFVGRKSETINVGGAKVYPADVEACIRTVPGVEQVRVYAVPSSLTGQLVGAEVQPTAGLDHTALETAIVFACRQGLARHQVPSIVTFRDQLALNDSGKLTRGEALHGV